MSVSDLELAFEFQLKAYKIPQWERELVFAPPRRFRFDFAWETEMLAVEIDGGTFVKGGHSTGVGIHTDCVKSSEASVLGWKVMHFDKIMIESGEAIDYLRKALGVY